MGNARIRRSEGTELRSYATSIMHWYPKLSVELLKDAWVELQSLIVEENHFVFG